MSFTPEDKKYLEQLLEECAKKGHTIFEWGGMQYCDKCGSATYLIWKRDHPRQS